MKNKIPLVSVVIPNYNHALYLEDRIESVLNQTFQNFELIILDDASTDNSVELIKRYKENVHVTHLLFNKENGGSPFSQWKKGFDLAKGEYIWIAESDDFADSSFLECSVSLLDKYQNAAFCFSSAHFLNEDGHELEDDEVSCLITSEREWGLFDGISYVKHNLFWGNCVYNASGVVFRKRYALQIDWGTCVSMKYAGDWLFWAKMALLGDVIEVYKKLNYFRKHPLSTTTKGVLSGESIFEDMAVVKYIETTVEIGIYKKFVRNGFFYKVIKRLRVSKEVQNELLGQYSRLFSCGYIAYLVERINKLLVPVFHWALTYDRDRLN